MLTRPDWAPRAAFCSLALLAGGCAGPGLHSTANASAATGPSQGAAAPPRGARVTLARVLEAQGLAPSELEAGGALDVTWTHRGQTHTYRGVPLGALAAEGVATRAGAVLVEARDGYHAVLSTYELDPQSGGTRAFVVWSVDGRPLGADEGPLRLVVPTDGSGARCVRQIARLAALPIEPHAH
ncbi:MAG: molybdopterin-dependent oxidoreductase [Planctomycetes bacterium]|nr:molybdopterin-dependent oxidoreductase [Planctomycetota bacterium]